MLDERMNQLGAERFGAGASDPVADAKAFEDYLGTDLPADYKKVLMESGGAVFFSKGALYRPEQASPWADGVGLQDIEMLYGLGEGSYSLWHEDDCFRDKLPDWTMPIGEAAFGNQICLAIAGNDKGAVYFWDHEHDEGTGLYRIAPSFDAFLAMLEPDPKGDVVISGEDL